MTADKFQDTVYIEKLKPTEWSLLLSAQLCNLTHSSNVKRLMILFLVKPSSQQQSHSNREASKQ